MNLKLKKSLAVILSFLLIAVLPTFGQAANVTEKEPNDTYQTANAAAFGDVIRGTCGSSDSADYYRFVPDANGYVTVRFSHAFLEDTSARWQVRVYRFTSELTEIYETAVPGTDAETVLPKIGLEKGSPYYIAVRSLSHAADGVAYTIVASFTATDCFESEPNDSYKEADAFTLGSTYGGFSAGGYDYYKLTPDKNGYLSITFEHEYLEDASARWDLRLYRFTSELQEIYETHASGTEAVTALPHIGVEKGSVYYLRVDAVSSAACDVEYALSVSLTPTDCWESEPNDSYKEADTFTLGKTYGGFSAGGYDYYKITPDQNGYLSVSFAHEYLEDASVRWGVRVYRFTSELREIYDTHVSGTDALTELPGIGVEKGSAYYIRVDAVSSGACDVEYQLTVSLTPTEYWESEPNDSYKEADAAAFGKTYGGFSSGGYDYYKLTPDETGSLIINFEHPYIEDASARWGITTFAFTDSLKEVARGYAAGTDEVTLLPAVSLEKGVTYYVRIDAISSEACDVEYAVTFSFTNKAFKLGDLDFDGAITASDARLALRAAVGLEDFDALLISIGDVDFDGKITAADARKILRAAVQLEVLGEEE